MDFADGCRALTRDISRVKVADGGAFSAPLVDYETATTMTDPAKRYTGKLSARIRWRAPPGADPYEFGEPPLIDHWTILRKFWLSYPALAGSITGHPLLGDVTRAYTSPLFWICIETGFARTVSRYYRLGQRASAEEKRRPIYPPLELLFRKIRERAEP
jgi:hypothetical protein